MDLDIGCTIPSSAKGLFLVVSCAQFSETAGFQVKEALDFWLLWALMQVLDPGKSPS